VSAGCRRYRHFGEQRYVAVGRAHHHLQQQEDSATKNNLWFNRELSGV